MKFVWKGLLLTFALATNVTADTGGDSKQLQMMDIFQIEYASDPQISPDGKKVVYVRNFMDVMKDRRRSNLWIVDVKSGDHRPLTSGDNNARSPRWSPDGKRLAYVSSEEGSSQLYMFWMDSGLSSSLSRLTAAPGNISWSPDGKQLAFSMAVPVKGKPLVSLPAKPKGAEWAKSARYIDKLQYRADGAGYLEEAYQQLFVIPADGGSPRQLTKGEYQHNSTISWTRDSLSILVGINRKEDWQYDPLESEIWKVSLADGSMTQVTDRNGPDGQPLVSPDGKKIAWLGFDDRGMGYHNTEAYVMDIDGGNSRSLTVDLDRSIADLAWSSDSKGVYLQYDDYGDTLVAWQGLDGKRKVLLNRLGGTSIGRPYAGGSFTVAANGTIAYTLASVERPADVAVLDKKGKSRQLTWLNDDLLVHKQLGEVEEMRHTSSFDGREIQSWLVKPANYEEGKKYPLILEIHGGPFANYGFRFSTEVQMYAAAGYAVLYVNPRGSTSYGDEFANLIHHNYPGQDYDDLVSAVDAAIAKGFVDENELYVTGGSGGGVLTAWIVGKTNRFKAAVVAKPVINWFSFALTADFYSYFYQYWFQGLPWDYHEAYYKRSPLSLVGNVETPTMLLTGEADYRTPISESEQYYQALQLRKVDTALVRIPDASHGIASRPSHLMSKIAHILAWFEKYRPTESKE